MAWNEVFWTGSSSGVVTAAVVWLLSVLWVFREVLAHRSERVRETWLRGRVVWITGASSGIGRALAFRLAVRYGARVIVSARRVERLESLAVQVQEALQAQDKGSKRAQHTTLPSVLIEPMDLLGNMASIEETVRRVRRHRASIVILNAGVNQGGQLFTNTSMETLRQVLQINLWAPVQIIRLLLEQSPSHLAHAEDGIVADKSVESVIEPKPCRGQRSASAKRRWRVHDLGTHLRILAAMRDMFGFRPDTMESCSEASFASVHPAVDHPRAKVATAHPLHFVLVSSLASYRALPGGSLYGATKAALNYLAESLRIELAISGNHAVRFTTVCPGFVDTPAIAAQQHWKPFCQSSEAAADHIIRALLTDRDHYGFPWIMERIVLQIARILPTPVYRWIMKRSWQAPTAHQLPQPVQCVDDHDRAGRECL